MRQLITIETVPISLELIEKKPIKIASGQTAKLEISREDNHTTIRSNPLEIRMDSFRRNPAGDISYTATADYDKGGRLSMDVNFSQNTDIPQRSGRISRSIDKMLDTLPKASYRPSDTFVGGGGQPISGASTLKINFDMSSLGSLLPAAETSFMPPDLEVQVSQLPKVIVKYVGGPIYFPRSADPNYVAPAYMDEPPAFDIKI